MDDKNLMENLLSLTKGTADLYLHGSIESATPNVRNTFKCGLADTLEMQSQIYDAMATRGWYPAEQAEQQKVQQAKQKFINS